MFKFNLFILPLIFSAQGAIADPEMHLRFHMGMGAEGKFEIGGTIVNTGDESIDSGFISYVTFNQKCVHNKIHTYNLGEIKPSGKLSFRIPVDGKLVGYKIIGFGGVDRYGFPVANKDDTREVLAKRMVDEKKTCQNTQ